jgi:hypothetical protein
MKKLLTSLIFGIMFIYALVKLFTYAVDKEMLRECIVWKEQSQEYSLFYLSETNQAGCESIGVIIDAPFAPATK